MPVLAYSLNDDLSRGFTVAQVAEKHGWTEPMVWSLTWKAEFTAIIEPAPEGGDWAICPEIFRANGQGETIEEAKNRLREAIELILED